MEWYYYVIIGAAALIVIAALIFLIAYLKGKASKNKRENELKDFYLRIMKAAGGKENITEVSNMSSRLMIKLNDMDKMDSAELNKLIEEGVGAVKANRKITLVIGDKASEYCEKINEELKK